MLKGDLTATPLAPLLVSLADDSATGCLHISDPEGDEALVYFKGGLVYAVSVPGRRPQLGSRLVSSGALAPEALAEALEAQRTELQGWRLGELLVHLGYVDQPVVEAFVIEQVHDALWDLMRWDEGRWKFRKNEKTREDVGPPMTVESLLADLLSRQEQWDTITAVVHGPTAVPVLSTRNGGSAEMSLDADAWSLLCKIDGERSVAELARDCGYTIFECAAVISTLVQSGLVDVEDDVEPEEPPAAEEPTYGVSSIASAFSAQAASASAALPLDEPVDELVETNEFSELARLVAEATAQAEPVEETPSPVALRGPGDEEMFSQSIARVSAALTEVLGAGESDHDPFHVPLDLLPRKRKTETAKPARDPDAERRERLRAAAAAELASAHAMAEAMRYQAESESPSGDVAGAEIVDLDTVRREAAEREAAEEAARLAAEEQARLEAEEAARLEAEEAARLEAEEAARLAAENAAAEDEAWTEYAEREAAAEAARLEAEEAARLEAEEAARLAAEIAAAEDEAWAEYAEREAAEEAARLAAEEQARLEAEEAARLEAEEAARLAAEEQARLEAEEAARLAAEEQARLEAEEAERQAAAELARMAAEEAERQAAAEAERIAAEEAERQAAADAAAEASIEEERVLAEQAHRELSASEFAAASALLSELSTATLVEAPPVTVAPEQQPDPGPYAPAAAAAADTGWAVTVPAPSGPPPSERADTAALLRELSSLGLDDEPSAPAPTPTRPPTSPRPVSSPPADKKKKRGLFGR